MAAIVDTKLKVEKKVRRGFYVSNMLRTFNENIQKIERLFKEINQKSTTLNLKEHHEILDSIKCHTEELVKMKLRVLGLINTGGFDLKNGLDKLIKDIFELHRQVYRLNLDIRALKVDEFFKIDNNEKITKDLLREVLHTIQLSIPNFDDYFKYKRKDKEISKNQNNKNDKNMQNKSPDYRTPIRWLSFKDKTFEHCLKKLFDNPSFSSPEKGRDRLFVAEFPNLQASDFNRLAAALSPNSNHAMLSHVYMYDHKCIIFYLKDFNGKSMDLHGCDLSMANAHANTTIRNAFLNFSNNVTLITGKGLHSASGKSSIKPMIVQQLTAWMQTDKHFIQSYKIPAYNEGSVEITFHPPKTVHFSKLDAEIAHAVQNEEHRIIVKLDRKYTPSELQSLAIRLTLKVIMTSDGNNNIGSVFPEQSKEPCDYIRLFFNYNNGLDNLFNFNDGFLPTNNRTAPVITMSIPVQDGKEGSAIKNNSDNASAANAMLPAFKRGKKKSHISAPSPAKANTSEAAAQSNTAANSINTKINS